MKAPDSQIAVTLYNLRDYCQTESDLDRTLDKVCAIGYQAVQVSGTPLAADVIRKQLDKHNLFCCATHENLQTISGDVAPLIDRLQTLGCDFTALKALADRLQLSPGATPAMVEVLVRKRLLERTPCPLDRRAVRIRTTDTCRRLVAEGCRYFTERTVAFLEALPETERSSLLEVLKEFHRSISTHQLETEIR